MNAIFENKTKVQLISGVVSLVALLIYTLVHTGGLLSHYVYPALVGYIAAFGIELAVVSLSLRIGELRRSKQSSGFFLFVLISVVFVSAIANIAEGFFTLHGEQLTLDTVKQLDFLQATIGVVATGLISLIVLALSEIVGTDVNETAKAIEKERKASVKVEQQKLLSTSQLNTFTEQKSVKALQAEHARSVKAEQSELSKQKRLDTILYTLTEQPDIALTTLAEQVNISRTTLYTYLDELKQQGKVKRNGQGVKVVNDQGGDK